MSSPKLPTALAATLALTAAVAAQNTFVTPSHFENVEAPTRFSWGLATSSATHRFLQVNDELQGTARTIRAISFRRDGTTATSTHNGGTMLVNVFVSTAATTAAAPDATFDNNHGADKMRVGSNLIVRLPQSDPGMGPRDFDYRIPFQQPFQYAGNGPLCVEIQVTSNTSPGGLSLDGAYNQSTNPAPTTWSFGTGCIAATTQTRAMRLTLSTSTNWSQGNSRLYLNGSYLPPSSLVFLVFGFQNLSLGGIPLPFELPGSAPAPSGPCTIYNDIQLDLPQLTSGTGSMNAQVDVPIQPSAHGVNIYAQTLATDAGANPFGIVASNSTRVQYIAPYGAIPCGMVYDSNGLGATGTVRANYGMIMRVEE